MDKIGIVAKQCVYSGRMSIPHFFNIAKGVRQGGILSPFYLEFIFVT